MHPVLTQNKNETESQTGLSNNPNLSIMGLFNMKDFE